MHRRQFEIFAASIWASAGAVPASQNPRSYSVGVIGHTGRGNYGHGLDTVWARIAATFIVGLADAHADGRGHAAKKLKIADSVAFEDYNSMLAEVRPDLVAVCPRYADEHCKMILAAIEHGAKGIYVEKPFVQTPAEADQVLVASRESGCKVAVAHRNRYHPTLKVIDRLLEEGRIGRLLEVRGRGKGDRRGGAEDLWVLGSHVLNLMSYFSGGVRCCSASMLQDGEPVTKKQIIEGAEGLGPLAGNEVHARYEFESGLIGYFDSLANDGTMNAGFGLQLVGSEGIIQIQCDVSPLAYLIPGNPFAPTKNSRPWLPITSAGVDKPEPAVALIAQVQAHDVAVRDLIEAIENNRSPLCDAKEGANTVEMIHAVFQSHFAGGRSLPVPLQQRSHVMSS